MFIVLSIRKMRFVLLAIGLGVLLLGFSSPLLNKAQEIWGTPLQGKLIALDAGHGGPDGGACNSSGIFEKNINLKICYYVRDYLQSAGASVVMTRETDTDLADSTTKGLSKRKAEDLHRRLQLVEDAQADILVSVHLNAIPSTRWFGAQTFFNPTNESNKKLADSIQTELTRNLENTTRQPRPKDDVYLLRESRISTALVEAGFLSNPQEAALLASEAYQKKVAAAIYYGILHYYDKGSNAPTS